MQYVWKFGLFDKSELHTTDGVPFEIIDPGIINTNSGPDFFNAKIKYKDTIWAGNVELHNNSSDWYNHNHHKDRAYDSVILNVVLNKDTEIFRIDGDKINQFKLSIPDSFIKDVEFLCARAPDYPACLCSLGKIDKMYIEDWFCALSNQRLINKSKRIYELVDIYKGNWEEVFYIILSRSFGTGINSDSFERMARSLPFNYILKHLDSRLQTEALFFGQAGFLCDNFSDPYYLLLKREYGLLKTKFKLKNIDKSSWKLFRLRPNSFPQLRIAFLASLFYTKKRLPSLIIDARSLTVLRELFDLKLSSFWDKHYQFEDHSETKEKSLGTQTIDSIIINSVVPFLFAYGYRTGNEKCQQKALYFLENIPPENNKFVRMWSSNGMPVKNAFDSQAIIELQRNYCETKKCMFCRIGHKLLSQKF